MSKNNLILITVEQLRSDFIYSFKAKEWGLFVFEQFLKQGHCFLNFRLPSPDSNLNKNFLLKGLDESIEQDIYFRDDDEEDIEAFFHEIDCTKQFCVWRHFPVSALASNPQENILLAQERTKEFCDILASKKAFNENTFIILMGMSGHYNDESRKHKVFDNLECSLYDENIHVPLVIFHPNASPKNISPSVNLFDVEEAIIRILDEGDIESKVINLMERDDCLERSNIITHYQNTYGFRGPMFQYFCSIKDDQVIEQELYDLNNDYKMKNDLLLNPDQLSGQIIDLVKNYQKRVLGSHNRK